MHVFVLLITLLLAPLSPLFVAEHAESAAPPPTSASEKGPHMDPDGFGSGEEQGPHMDPSG